MVDVIPYSSSSFFNKQTCRISMNFIPPLIYSYDNIILNINNNNKKNIFK